MNRLNLSLLFFCISAFILCGCSDDNSPKITKDEEVGIPHIIEMKFLAGENVDNLVSDVECIISGDSVVECWIRHFMKDKMLIPHVSFEGDHLELDAHKIISDETAIDFSKPVTMTVVDGAQRKDYRILVHAFTGLPTLWIETENNVEITSKDTYVNARFTLIEDVVTRSPGDVDQFQGKIKGRGNSTWDFPKKPYALKFSEKVSFFGEPADKSWVLLANYTDKTSLRNATAFYMGELSNLDWTPRMHFVEVMLNGRYNGTYQLGEKIKISKNRVNVDDSGILFEIDNKAAYEPDARYFYVEHIAQPVNIKDPEVEYNDATYQYASSFLKRVDETLFSDNFTDPVEGWRKYMDEDSFVDWYLINEISKNNDACFWSSCFMNLKKDGKLKMGPLWDFDIAFGNVYYNGNDDPEGFWIKSVTWYDRLFQDPLFVAKVKQRFGYFYDRKTTIFNEINENATYLKYAMIENDSRWNILYNPTWPNHDVWGNYQNEVQCLKTWLDKRFDWLKSQFDNM